MYCQLSNMSNKPSDNQSLDLSGLDFGPAWARKGASGDKPAKKYKEFKGERPQRKERNDRDGRPAGGRRPQQGKRDFRSNSKPRRVFVPATEGVTASIMPIEEGVDNLVKEISESGRTYSVFDLARVILGSRDRFQIVFKSEKKELEFFQSKQGGAVFLTKEECLAYAGNKDSEQWLSEIYLSEEIDAELPTGNYQNVAKCGYSGEPLGPTNFHGYQDKVLEMHRSRFSHLSLEEYRKRIVSESGEEVVAKWKESMAKRTIYKLKSDETVMFDNQTAMLQHFSAESFDQVFHKTQKAQVPSEIEAKKLSPGLLSSLKEIIQDQRRYPGDLSSFLCRQLSGRQLAVFKWQGKLHCGPSRPHQVSEDLVIADRPKTIYDWAAKNIGGGVDALWKEVFPEKIEEKERQLWFHDLHWLINEGYVIFMNSGLLFPSSASKKPNAKQGKQNSKKDVSKAKVASQSKELNKEQKPAEKTEPKVEVKETATEEPKAVADVDSKEPKES